MCYIFTNHSPYIIYSLSSITSSPLLPTQSSTLPSTLLKMTITLEKTIYLPVSLTKDLDPNVTLTAFINTEMYVDYEEPAIFNQYFSETIIDCFSPEDVELLVPLAKYLFKHYVDIV